MVLRIMWQSKWKVSFKVLMVIWDLVLGDKPKALLEGFTKGFGEDIVLEDQPKA